MSAVQAEDVRVSFLFVDDLDDHHQKRLGNKTTNHDIAALVFATVSGWDKLVIGPIDAPKGTLVQLMTDISYRVQVTAVAPRCSSDHSSLLQPFRWNRLFLTCV